LIISNGYDDQHLLEITNIEVRIEADEDGFEFKDG
jgi:hypothetical protein